MLIYSYSPSLSQISLTNSFGKVVFQNLAKIEMTPNENRLFGRHFETEQHFKMFFAELRFFIARTYMVQISLQNSGGKVVFSGGSMVPPWAPTGVKVPWSLKCYMNTCVQVIFWRTESFCIGTEKLKLNFVLRNTGKTYSIVIRCFHFTYFT